ncbi:hypothetical protein NQ318_000960 [Aromia moschata]|uniref:GH18 domain-containing protein n=1 Tax=Aromia moschata TaxID=1265417 RepID=A0AAV8ZGI3_9CUCU|nr:hypothetical protein NQ318_000960 [Aromia moschata]
MGLLVFAVLSIIAHYSTADVRVVCYYGSWSSYDGYNPEDFDARLCTHVNYGFMSVWENGNVKVEDDSLDIDQGLYYKVTNMKNSNPNLKVLLSVGGGGSEDLSTILSGVVADAGKRAAFLGSASYFIQTYNFDGLDVDWEYPSGEDKANFITLLQELRDSFNLRGWLLTAAVSADPRDGYDVPQMNNLLDFINVMTYDMYGSWSSYTGQCSPLYASSVESDWEKQNLNLAAASNNWVNAGASKEKLSIGVAFYGRSFTLADPNQHGLHAPISGVGVGDGGAINYRDICATYDGWTRVWDDEQKNPYKYSGNQWFGYDDGDSIWIKTAYIKDNGFGGVMVWALDSDDVHGNCGLKQTLLKHINGALGKIDCC